MSTVPPPKLHDRIRKTGTWFRSGLTIKHILRIAALFLSVLALAVGTFAQATAGNGAPITAVELGSRTAKGGFRNEDEIAAKFNAWRTDAEAAVWLGFMGYRPGSISSVAATKPHGEKADVVVRISLTENLTQRRGDAKSEPPASAGGQPCRTGNPPQSRGDAKQVDCREGISIKLVSSPTGFNQIDKRWLATYAKMWRMPADVVTALKLFVGETPPTKKGRDAKRMYLNELDPREQKTVIDFFAANKSEIVSDLFKGDGEYSAGWFMVANKSGSKTRWVLRSIEHVIKFFGDGPVEITRAGNLKIGRITMQRKGGDGGRDTAKMLQFKINPALVGL